MKRLFFLTIICCYTLTGRANITADTDSLQKILQTVPHDTIRLSILKQIIKIEQNNAKCIHFSDILLKEAIEQKNDEYASLAAYYHLVYYYNRCEQDSIAKWLNIMEPLVVKSGLWDYYFDAKRFQIDLYTYNGKYELAISESHKMQKRAQEKNSSRGLVAAYQCLSNAYIGSLRWDDGVKALEKAHKLLTDKDNPVVRISVATQLVSVTKSSGDNKKLFKYLQELEIILHSFIAANPSLVEGFYDVFIFNEIFYSYYYLNIQQPQQAYEHIIKGRKFLNENTYLMYQVLYYDVNADYYQSIKEYPKAENYIDSTLLILKNDLSSEYAEQLLKKAKVMVESGRSNLAYPIYQRALQMKDSIAAAISNIQMEQIKNTYDIKTLELKKTKLKNEMQLIGLVVIITILIVLFFFLFRIYRVKKALKKSEYEIRKATQTVKNLNEMKNRFLTSMSYNIRTPLNNVVGFSQLIASESNMQEEIRKEYSDIIHKSSEDLMELVNDVLDLSRLEAKMMKFQIQDCDMVTLCYDISNIACMRNEGNGINIQFSSEVKTQIVRTDSNRLAQALLTTLTYPQKCYEEREIQFILNYTSDFQQLCIRIINSPLADPAISSQEKETSIKHDISRLLFEHFGGSYRIDTDAPKGRTIIITYPFV